MRVTSIQKDYASEPRLVYDPTHPDAHQDRARRRGTWSIPNVNIVNEMVDMIEANRAYEANSAVINGTKAMFLKALEIGR